MKKVEGYPDLRKNGAAVVNVNHSEYQKALKRKMSAGKVETLEREVKSLHDKLDLLMEKLNGLQYERTQ